MVSISSFVQTSQPMTSGSGAYVQAMVIGVPAMMPAMRPQYWAVV